jgi:hypothetical protein
MTGHSLAVMLFGGAIFQVGCAFGAPKDTRPWTAPRVGSLCGGLLVITAAIWLAVNAL